MKNKKPKKNSPPSSGEPNKQADPMVKHYAALSQQLGDDVERFFNHGVLFATKTLYLGSAIADFHSEGGVDSLLAEKVIKSLMVLDEFGDDSTPLTIILNNPGGDEIHGLAIYDAIKQLKSTVHVKVYGQAMSMAAIILQAGDKRFMSANSKFMMHYGEASYQGHPLNIQKWIKDAVKVNKWMEQLFYKKMKSKLKDLRIEEVRRMLEFDTVLSAKEALKSNLIDKVIPNGR